MNYKERVLDAWNQEFKLDAEEIQAYRAGIVDLDLTYTDLVSDLPDISTFPLYESGELVYFATPGLMPWFTGCIAYSLAVLLDEDFSRNIDLDGYSVIWEWGNVLECWKVGDSRVVPPDSWNGFAEMCFDRTGIHIPPRFLGPQSLEQQLSAVTAEQKTLLAVLFSAAKGKSNDEWFEQGIQNGLDSYLGQFLPST